MSMIWTWLRQLIQSFLPSISWALFIVTIFAIGFGYFSNSRYVEQQQMQIALQAEKEKLDTLLKSTQASHQQLIDDFKNYKQQQQEIDATLSYYKQLSEESNDRLQEVLNHGNNKSWADVRVPDDIIILFSKQTAD